MINFIYIYVVFFIIIIFYFFTSSSLKKIISRSLNFDNNDNNATQEKIMIEERKILFQQYLKHQKYVFTLLFSLLIFCGVLVFIIISRLIIKSEVNYETVSSVFILIGNIPISKGVYSLYRNISDKLDKIIM